MRIHLFYLVIFFALVFSSCGGEGMNTQNENNRQDTDSTSVPEASSDSRNELKPDCPLDGKVLEGNKIVLRDEALLFYIVADSSTFDETYGDSHRVLEVYDAKNCKQAFKVTLPINTSPDFPYYIADINYNNESEIVAIKGFYSVYCFDIRTGELLPELKPQFFGERYGADTQSGKVLRLEVWEHYLMGFAEDYGAFAFDLSDKQNPKTVLPFAEYEISEEAFGSLFLFPSDGETHQVVLPTYDIEKDEFSINPLFEKPEKISLNIPKSARNNRFLVLRTSNEQSAPFAIDLQNYKRVDLPQNVAEKSTNEILEWVKGQ